MAAGCACPPRAAGRASWREAVARAAVLALLGGGGGGGRRGGAWARPALPPAESERHPPRCGAAEPASCGVLADLGIRVVRREPGTERSDLPVFTAAARAVRLSNVARRPAVQREDVPGAFLLRNVASDEECSQIIATSEAMGYTEDAPVSLGRHIRRNENCVWVTDSALSEALFERCRPHLPPKVGGGPPVGLNMRWRLYRYGVSDVFRPHIDGSWPGSGIDNTAGEHVQDLFNDRWSQLTWVLYLNDDFAGGGTRFFMQHSTQTSVVEVSAERGAVLCFFHGEHPLSPLHEGGLVVEGTKYIVRSDVLYAVRPAQRGPVA